MYRKIPSEMVSLRPNAQMPLRQRRIGLAQTEAT